jgi:hypothetical protein
MRHSLTILLLLCGGLTVAEDVDPELLQAEMRELKTVIQSLRAENRRLRSANEALREELVRMRGRPAPAPSEPAPSAPLRDERIRAGEPPASAEGEGTAVLYVNPNWHYLIVGQGAEQGIAKGAVGEVRRNGQAIARVEVTDTKPSQAVLDLDPASLSAGGTYPKAGDAVVFE